MARSPRATCSDSLSIAGPRGAGDKLAVLEEDLLWLRVYTVQHYYAIIKLCSTDSYSVYTRPYYNYKKKERKNKLENYSAEKSFVENLSWKLEFAQYIRNLYSCFCGRSSN